MADDRWTIRGVVPELQRAVAARARADRRTVGAWVSATLAAALAEAPPAAAADSAAPASASALPAPTAEIERLERRIEALEARLSAKAENGPDRAPSLALADHLTSLAGAVESVLGRGDPAVRLARRAATGDHAAYRELTVAIAHLPEARRARLAPWVAQVDAALVAIGGT